MVTWGVFFRCIHIKAYCKCGIETLVLHLHILRLWFLRGYGVTWPVYFKFLKTKTAMQTKSRFMRVSPFNGNQCKSQFFFVKILRNVLLSFCDTPMEKQLLSTAAWLLHSEEQCPAKDHVQVNFFHDSSFPDTWRMWTCALHSSPFPRRTGSLLRRVAQPHFA